MSKTIKIILLSAMLISGIVTGFVKSAQATVTVTPMMVLIEGRDRFKDINFINTGDEENNYAVEWLYFKQEEGNGYYTPLEASATEFDLAKHVVYTPKRFALKPRGVQKVRLAMRLNGEPPPAGDYRAHLLFKKTGERASVDPNSPVEPGKQKVGIRINVGFSIPIIYRSGVSDATAHIGDITTEINKNNKKVVVNVPVERKGGPYSLLGQFFVYNNEKLVGQLENGNLFSEIRQRTFPVTLTVDKLEPGNLRVVYKDFDLKKNIVLSEKSISVN